MDFQHRMAELAAQGAEGVAALVDEIIREGLRRAASDIHIEPAPGGVQVRFRQDGVLLPAVEAATDRASNLIARIKVLADLLTYHTNVPQEGRIDRAKVNSPSDLRVSTFPTVHGEKAVLRLFDPTTQSVALGELGYAPALREQFESRLREPGGAILLTGPAGSGKTTTIYAAVQYILQASKGARNVVTIEDPVERILPGATQTQVHPASGLTFARCLRSMMRQDPEVIVVGEIRDGETAGIAIEASLTGHMVISTIHSGAACGVLTRLLEMGVEPYLLTSALSFAVAQRLVRLLCPDCRVEISSAQAGLPELAGPIYESAGCEKCFGTGYRGRTIIAEALAMTPPMRRKVMERPTAEDLAEAAIVAGMVPLRQAALDRIRAGETSPSEMLRVLGPAMSVAG